MHGNPFAAAQMPSSPGPAVFDPLKLPEEQSDAFVPTVTPTRPASSYPQRGFLGEIVTWDAGSVGTITVDMVKNALAMSGLEPDECNELNVRNAFGRVCGKLRKDRVIDKVAFNGDEMEFQFTRKHLDKSSKTIDFNVETKVVVNVKSGDIRSMDPTIEAHARKLLAECTINRKASDITRMVQRMFAAEADLFPINPRKGVAYFVPEKFRDFTEKIDNFLKAIGGTLWRFPVPKGDENAAKGVRDAVENGLTEMLTELQDAANGWTSDGTRKSTCTKSLDKFRRLRLKVEAYGDYLKDRADEMIRKSDAIKTEMIRKAGEVLAPTK